MRNDKKILIRDKVDLYMRGGRRYKSIVADIGEDRLLYVGVPSYAGIPMMLHENQELFLAFYRESGKYIVEVRVKGFQESGNVRLALLETTSEPEKEQRREFYRLPISLTASICEYIEDMDLPRPTKDELEEIEVLETASTINVSASGAGLKTKRSFELGDKFLILIYLNWPHPQALPFVACAEVKRCVYDSEKEANLVGVHFVEVSESMSANIAKFILVKQQQRIRQRKLIEGD